MELCWQCVPVVMVLIQTSGAVSVVFGDGGRGAVEYMY